MKIDPFDYLEDDYEFEPKKSKKNKIKKMKNGKLDGKSRRNRRGNANDDYDF